MIGREEKRREEKRREEYIDTLRVFACFLVVLTHSTMPSINGSDGFWVFTLAFICSASSELFLTISGALLLPAKVSMGDFYKKRFIKIIPPLLFWSIVGGIIEIIIGRFTVEQYINGVLMIPFKPITGVYWFMYVMIGLYLVAPIISEWLRIATKRQLHFVLSIWGITLLWPYSNMIIGTSFLESGSHYQILNYFGGFVGYWILGHYLRKYPIKIGWNIGFILPVTTFILNTTFILFCKLSNNENYTDLLVNLQIGSASMVVLIFTVIQNIFTQQPNSNPSNHRISFKKVKQSITEIAKYSFGIYLIHIWIVRDLVWPIFENYYRPHVLIQSPLTAVISILISYVIVKAISKLPYGKYVIGI